MRIPIVMLADEHYISPIRVAIWTMRKSTCADVFLEITMLCSDKLGEKDRCRLQELENILTNVRINFYEVDLKVFKSAKVFGYLSVATFFRLIIGEVLKEDKCIFLDGDIIVNIDLQELYVQDVKDFYLAGVRDISFLTIPEEAIKYSDLYGFNHIRDYINAGVLVINLAKLREDHLQEQFFESMKMSYPRMDQDILNKVCEGKIKHIDLKYNFLIKYRFENFIEEGINAPTEVILHFAGKYKPWNNHRMRGAKEWWEYAKEALEEIEYNRLYADALKMIEQGDWTYIVDHCSDEETVIVIGYSRIGVDVFNALKCSKIKGKIYICDNSEVKRNLSNENMIIHSIEELAEGYYDALWVNTSQLHGIEINHQLTGLGVKEDRILNYVDKTMSYYEILDDEYIEYELQQLRLKVIGT